MRDTTVPEVAESRMQIAVRHDHPLMSMIADMLNNTDDGRPLDATVMFSKGPIGLTLCFTFMNAGETSQIGNNEFLITMRPVNITSHDYITYVTTMNEEAIQP